MEGRILNNVLAKLSAWLMTASIAACATTTVDKYVAVPNARLDQAFVKPGADLGKYHSVYVEPISVWFPRRAQLGPTEDQLERAQGIFSAAVEEALTADGGYPVVYARGPGVLTVRAQFVAFTDDAAAAQALSNYTFVTEPGKVTLVAELIDSQTGETLLRAADVEKSDEYSIVDNPEDRWGEIEAAVRRWANIFRTFMDEVHQGSAGQ